MQLTVDTRPTPSATILSVIGIDAVGAFHFLGGINQSGRVSLLKKYDDHGLSRDYAGWVTPWGIVGSYIGGIFWVWKTDG